jgi:hypothetical protein
MQNKLQELTDKLYNEGLSKGRQDAEDMRAKAKSEAQAIITEANNKANEIISKAKKEAQELREKTESDIKMAASQAIATIKQETENAILYKAMSSDTNAVINNDDFIKSIILTIVKAFNPSNSESVSLNLILPEAKQKEMDSFIESQVKSICNAGLNVSFSKNLSNGFKIGPSNEGYILSFTGNDFQNLIAEYLRPKTRSLLFGSNE